MSQRDGESYSLGAFTTRELAENVGRRECFGRGHKYGYEVSKFTVDHYDPDDDSPLDDIISTHGNDDLKNE